MDQIDIFSFPPEFIITLFRYVEEHKWGFGTVSSCMNRTFGLDYTLAYYKRIYRAACRARGDREKQTLNQIEKP